ncbi:hypothetical protein KAR91_86915 [Candidatus Pacearchaeota archaeon]|nr:hypothetical protein [Candidatus Pacearchaeota archaeon]
MADLVKLNLGCGKHAQKGFVNIDIVAYPGVDLVTDISSDLPNHFDPESIDEIYAKDVLEHLTRDNVVKALADWSLILKSGGIITLQFPDARKHCEMLMSGGWDIDRFNYQFFGGQDGDPYNEHKIAFNDANITKLLSAVGINVVEIVHFTTLSTFNMKVSGVKQ